MKSNYLLTDQIIFENKPIAVPYNYRISYKVSQLCIIFQLCCYKGGCSLVKLHMISVALTTEDDGEKFKDFIQNEFSNYTLVRFDPVVNRAVKYMLFEGIILQQKNGLFRLTQKGKSYVNKIIKDDSLMIIEKRYLRSISYKLSEEKIKWLMTSWRYTNVKNQ